MNPKNNHCFQNATSPLARRRNSRRRQGAVLAIELVVALPILLVILLAFVEFGILLTASQGISAAAQLGAREAVLPGATSASVNATIQSALAGYIWRNTPAPNKEVVIFVNGLKDNGVNNRLANAVSGDVVTVTLTVKMQIVAPNLLQFVGVSIQGKDLTTTFVTRKE